MINILITEFIDPEALKILSKDFNLIYKKDIWENSDYLKKESLSNFLSNLVFK